VKLEPLGNRVILEEIGESKMTRGGLLIPDAARKNKAIGYGRVLAVGPGRYTGDGKLIPCWCKEGDVIMFPRQAPAVLPLVDEHGNEKDVLMCPDNDIIGIVHDLPQVTHIAGLDGALLKMQPVSLARPDSAYANIAAIDESVSDLRQSGAPPDVIEEIEQQHRDEL
jgi:co-chaperonin GroES (HSP10)